MGYLLLLVYAAFTFIRPQEWVQGMVGSPIMAWIGGVAAVVSLFELAQRQWRPREAPQNGLILCFFIATLMRFVCDTHLQLFQLTLEDFGKTILIYYLVAINVNTLPRLKGMIWVVAAGCVFMAIHGVMQWHAGAGFGGQRPLFIERYKEIRVIAFGFFNDPNDLALMLVMALPFALSAALRPGASAPSRFLWAGCAALLIYCTFRTNSRGGWLALATTLAAYYVIHFSRKKQSVIVAGAILLAALLVAPSRMGTTSASEGSARGRLIAWADGNRMLKQWPVFGAGYSQFKEHSEGSMVAHNSFVHCYAELGLFGYFFFLALLYASFKDLAAIGARVDPENAAQGECARLARASMCSLIGFSVAAFFLSRTYMPALYLLFGIFAALTAIRRREVGPIENAFVRNDLKYVLIIELVSIPLLYIFVRGVI